MIDNEIDLVGRVRPVDPPQDTGARARAWTRLHAEITEAPRTRRRVARRRAARWLLPVGVAAAACTAAGIVAVLPGGHSSSSPEALTTRTLELAAAAVETQMPVGRPRPGQWVYTLRMDKYALQDGDVVGPEAMLHGKVKEEEWWRFDGRRLARSLQGGRLYVKGVLPGMGDRPPRRPDPAVNAGWIGGPGIWNSAPKVVYDYVAGLPTDPVALLARIRKDGHYRQGDYGRMFGRISGILRDDRLMPPKTTAAFYRALALMPGVSVAKDGTDYAGRHGIAVLWGKPGTRDGMEIILDARSYRYMGDSTQAVLGSAVVDHAGQRG
ncbi:CU044_5270 family protein [Actinoallomurus rhizosphaericola]|uniref:CU044_5270 family protein n=1 Tax=Actinoallomurus rhizosphaericola TaxID=2952536 RepID=UPI00209214FE|nr:CU044_5270 family protein [Actinoallomurus rhizosphaericola]MCO5998763.1 CU044_5270 family protein [Actinoallomurus rhizosphaericola]